MNYKLIVIAGIFQILYGIIKLLTKVFTINNFSDLGASLDGIIVLILGIIFIIYGLKKMKDTNDVKE